MGAVVIQRGSAAQPDSPAISAFVDEADWNDGDWSSGSGLRAIGNGSKARQERRGLLQAVLRGIHGIDVRVRFRKYGKNLAGHQDVDGRSKRTAHGPTHIFRPRRAESPPTGTTRSQNHGPPDYATHTFDRPACQSTGQPIQRDKEMHRARKLCQEHAAVVHVMDVAADEQGRSGRGDVFDSLNMKKSVSPQLRSTPTADQGLGDTLYP